MNAYALIVRYGYKTLNDDRRTPSMNDTKQEETPESAAYAAHLRRRSAIIDALIAELQSEHSSLSETGIHTFSRSNGKWEITIVHDVTSDQAARHRRSLPLLLDPEQRRLALEADLRAAAEALVGEMGCDGVKLPITDGIVCISVLPGSDNTAAPVKPATEADTQEA